MLLPFKLQASKIENAKRKTRKSHLEGIQRNVEEELLELFAVARGKLKKTSSSSKVSLFSWKQTKWCSRQNKSRNLQSQLGEETFEVRKSFIFELNCWISVWSKWKVRSSDTLKREGASVLDGRERNGKRYFLIDKIWWIEFVSNFLEKPFSDPYLQWSTWQRWTVLWCVESNGNEEMMKRKLSSEGKMKRRNGTIFQEKIYKGWNFKTRRRSATSNPKKLARPCK